MKAYCFGCKKKVDVKNGHNVNKKGRKFLMGKCSCGHKLSRILGKAKK